jgi:hypothetical protein
MVMFDKHHFGAQMPEGAIHPVSLKFAFVTRLSLASFASYMLTAKQ